MYYNFIEFICAAIISLIISVFLSAIVLTVACSISSIVKKHEEKIRNSIIMISFICSFYYVLINLDNIKWG